MGFCWSPTQAIHSYALLFQLINVIKAYLASYSGCGWAGKTHQELGYESKVYSTLFEHTRK